MRYADLVERYEAIEGTTKRLEMTGLLVGLLRGVPADQVARLVYLTQGQLRPDFEGVELGLAEKLVVRALAQASGSGEDRVTKLYKEKGDLGLAAEELRSRSRQRSLFAEEEGKPLTVAEVHAALLRIAQAEGAGSQEEKMRRLQELLARAEPKEVRYLVRTVSGKLRLGIADMSMLDALAYLGAFPKDPQARPVGDMDEAERAAFDAAKLELERAYNTSSDLGAVAEAVRRDGLKGLKALRLRTGVPVRPMLAERLSESPDIMEKMGGRCAAEYKYDGLRLQAHITKKEVRFFSRRLEQVTDQFPDVAEALREAFQGKDAIVEGEVVAVDAAGDLLPFSEVTHRRGRKHALQEAIEQYPVAVFLFDLLLLDGADLTGEPLRARRKALEKAFEVKGKAADRVRFAHAREVAGPKELDRFFEEAVAEGAEGIIAKSLDGEYRAGARGWQWIKLKRDYRAELSDSLDLVLVGAFWGRGRRAGWYGALLMAAYNEDDDTFETVCKLGTGFSDEVLDGLPKRFEKARRGTRHARVRSEMEPDVWFTPAHVLEVRGAEITVSPVHTCAWGKVEPEAGLAVRFPRFTGHWREDKAPEDATTAKEFLQMYRAQSKRGSGGG